MGVAIVVVAYRTGDTLARCLDRAHADAPDAPLLLVDHAYRPAQHAALVESRPWLRSLPSPDNPGFAAGANRGIEQALADDASHVLLLNADVYVRPGCVGRLTTAAGGSGAASPWLAGAGDAAYRGGRIDWERGYAGHEEGCDDYLIGGCIMISRAAWQATGPFDESFFLYCEDADWCLRARAAGVPLALVAEELADHDGGASTGAGTSELWAYWWSRNRIRLLRKHGHGSPTTVAVRQVAGAARGILWGSLPRRIALARVRGAVAGLRGV